MLINYLWKMHGYPQFSFWILITLFCWDLLFPHIHKTAQNIFQLEGTVLNRACKVAPEFETGPFRGLASFAISDSAQLSAGAATFLSSKQVKTLSPSDMIPTPLAIALAVIGWSPVTIMTLIPALRHLLTASGTAARGGSIIDIKPTKHKFSSGKLGG